MVGRDGITWNQVMDPEPEAYMGSIVDKMPNAFCYMGPNCGPGAGGAYLCVEGECELMIACVKKLLREKIKSICIKYVSGVSFSYPVSLTTRNRTERVKQYAAHVHSYLKGSIFGQPCKSWFKRGKEDGRNLAYYAGNALNLLYAQRNPKWEDFEYTYCDELQGNPVSWLANGYTVADYDGSSRTKYLDPSFIDYPPIPEDEDEPVSLEAKEESTSTNSINSLGGAIIQDAATQGVKIDSKAALFGVANA
jgi:hypothetical protein